MRISRAHRRVGIGAAAIALSGAVFGGVAGAAGAEGKTTGQGAAACPKGYFCVWPKKHYQGAMQKVAGNNKDLTRFGGAFGNKVRSAHNNGTSCDVRVFEQKNYQGRTYVFKKGQKSYGDGVHLRSNKWVNCK
ncbi:peptidase inhibitor family I36 protein [Streptomyces sp. HNM0574]|uniref:peptidase inhibitor family I36 protein n=1 Tax=Streptomyces sp. HNM0574 TaxID=2714954 RepID=UPI00146C950B|nr:peptidase inhibitor family I36 protein [Streptomyces sp. HNM0574]NLU68255.1 peptidase inhibitor family I36 protein [Streptomyces sp. HNM0574]